MGGIAFGQLAGYLLDHGFGYSAVFTFAGMFHVAAFLLILGFVPSVEPLASDQILASEPAR
jgi:ACS family hexuronate transporter-like MFS transporter